MRLYIENLEINKINVNNVEQYKFNYYKNIYFISENSISTIHNDTIFNINQIDYPIICFKINNNNVLLDKSKWKKGKEIYHIENNHCILNITTNEYILNKLDNIKLVIEYKIDNLNNNLYNVYFLLNKHNIKDPTQMDFYNIEIIDTFLSLLRNVN